MRGKTHRHAPESFDFENLYSWEFHADKGVFFCVELGAAKDGGGVAWVPKSGASIESLRRGYRAARKGAHPKEIGWVKRRD